MEQSLESTDELSLSPEAVRSDSQGVNGSHYSTAYETLNWFFIGSYKGRNVVGIMETLEGGRSDCLQISEQEALKNAEIIMVGDFKLHFHRLRNRSR